MADIYFEGEIKFPHYVNDIRKLIGKRIKYLQKSGIDHTGRGYIFPRYGTVTEVHGKNVRIDGDWLWAPNIVVYCELPIKETDNGNNNK